MNQTTPASFNKISGSESFTRWLVVCESKYESIQPFPMGQYESTALKELQ